MTPRARDQRGVVLPTRLLALCISAIAVAGLVFVANDPDKPREEAASPAVSQSSPEPTASPSASTAPAPSTPKPTPIKRGEVLVEVFNNTRVKGLAGGVADKAKVAGWNVVGSDNWYGSIDGTSVYFPPRLKEAAKALGKDLGIKHVRPAEEPMRFDRVTVILTDDYL